MVEFRSHLESVMQPEELRFNPTPSFGQYKTFLEQAIPHPAKMNTKLLKFLIEHFTKAGDTILDPMCGSGSTGVVAALQGRNAVQIDIEDRFIQWAEEARAKVERLGVLSAKGKIRNMRGDARKLSELLKEADVVLTSPPFANTISRHRGGKCTMKRVGISLKTLRSYDAVITSPPYGEAQSGRGIAKEGIRGGKHSPTDLIAKRTYMPQSFEHPENISRLPVDAVITSPPYGESQPFNDIDFMKGIQKELVEKAKTGQNKGNVKTEEAGKRNFEKMEAGNIESEMNIGNLGKETYLKAMLKVYFEMHKVLKPEGLAIIVIKPFIRRKKVIDLPYHTWQLLQKVGFKLIKLYKLRLKNPSFWRTLYKKKYPGVPEIKHEYILVTQKSLNEFQQS